MLLCDFWFKYHQQRIYPWKWHNCTFCRSAYGIRNNNRFSPGLLDVLTRIAPYLNHNQRRLIYGSFFTGQLSCCPLIWTFCSRQSNHIKNKLQELALGIIYNNYYSSFSELLEMSNNLTIHIKNTKVLTTDIYKHLKDLSPPIMNTIFQKQENYYSLRIPRSLVFKRKLTTT